MRYFIFNGTNLQEATSNKYETWHNAVAKKLLPQKFAVKAFNGNFYGLEPMYYGCFEKGDEILPFVLLVFHDVLEIKNDGIKVNMEANEILYFKTPEELEQEYSKQKKNILYILSKQ